MGILIHNNSVVNDLIIYIYIYIYIYYRILLRLDIKCIQI